MELEEAIEDVKKYISFANKEENFSSTFEFNWHKDLANRIDIVLKELEKANKQLDLDYVDNNYVSKDKIKAKIKDIKRELEILEKKNDCSMIYNPKDICKAEILRLKEILEGE